MRHRKRVVKLGRMSSHRKSMLANLAASLIIHKRVNTTVPKARAVVPLVDKLVTWAKKGTLSERRLAFRVLKDRTLVGKLFAEVGPLMAERKGGYTRVLRSGLIRPGDGAPMAILELVGAEVVKTEKKTKKKDKKTAK